jgi:hypothetical protein
MVFPFLDVEMTGTFWDIARTFDSDCDMAYSYKSVNSVQQYDILRYTLFHFFHHGHRNQNPFEDTSSLQVFDQPFNGLLESAFLGSLHRRLALRMGYRMSFGTV